MFTLTRNNFQTMYSLTASVSLFKKPSHSGDKNISLEITAGSRFSKLRRLANKI